MKFSDREQEVLDFIFARLKEVHGENENYDYMQAFKKIIEPDEQSKPVGECNNQTIYRKGHDKLWGWFGLGRASWLTLPRVLMHAMPDDWQSKMADLLDEYDEAMPNQPEYGTRVQMTDLRGALTKPPQWILNYRHPDKKEIEKVKDESCPD